MSAIMVVVVGIFASQGIFNRVMCSLCLTFLFCESVFGICIGCKMYEFFTHKKAKLCPGGICEFHHKHAIQKISLSQIITLIVFGIMVTGFALIIL